jgi:hypothetical protein
MSGAAVLRRLHDAGVRVRWIEPDRIGLSGPVTPDLVELARAAKAELLALVRPKAEPRPCACCGRFYFAEPTTMCFWCRSRRHGAKRDESGACEADVETFGPSVPASPTSDSECA